jgi:diguanylate cyclase (GGDEF)-like protein
MAAPSLPDRPGSAAASLHQMSSDGAETDDRFGPDSDVPDVPGADPAAVADLAGRWARLAVDAHPGLHQGLAGLLHRLAAACRDEQFWALRSRTVGRELLRSGLSGEWSGPRHPAEDVLPATLALLRERLAAAFALCVDSRRRLPAVLDEMAAGYAGALRDRVHREQEEDLRRRVAQVAAQDALTLLPNRAAGEQLLRRAFTSSTATHLGLCALDLDGFTDLNGALGHHLGDRLLVEVATRLHHVATPHLVTRTGGDEFAVLVECSDPRVAEGLAARIQEVMALPFRVRGRTVALSASIGVAVTNPATARPADLLRAASVALSWAKAQGLGQVAVFDPDRDAGESARATLLAELRAGVDRGEFVLHYQPLVRLADGRVRGAEALVRWQHPEQGLLGPGRFIEAAERSGAIVPLGRWVLVEACRQAAQWWRELGPRAPYVSVNVSPVQLAQADWVAEVTEVMELTSLPPWQLQLEITEQAVLEDEAAATAALSALRATGVRLTLDDFGTGYSGLAWLRQLPVHALKIDGSFIDGLRHRHADPVDRSIVEALIRMAHALDLEVTAEWVETAQQMEQLTALGCDLGQGHWLGRAGAAAWVADLWRRNIA